MFIFWPHFKFSTKFSIIDQIFNFWPNFEFLTKMSIFDEIFDLWLGYKFYKFPSETREEAIRLLDKIMKNIIANPDEEKYRKLKVTGKAVKEKIAPLKGTIEFLKTIGWEEVTLDGAPFYCFNSSVDQLNVGLEALNTTDLPKPKLHRNPTILEPQEGQSRIQVPLRVYNMKNNFEENFQNKFQENFQKKNFRNI